MTRTLVIGDIHGCAIELAHLLELVHPTRTILVGDVFRKGPDPMGVWELIKKHQIESVLGNHDARMLQMNEAGTLDQMFSAEVVAWLRGLPLMICEQHWVVVHAGLHPMGLNLEQRQHYLMRRWPDDSSRANPFWWELYSGEQLVLYGHDAKRGLVDRRPFTLGLDSGCVYGGHLSGYCIEEDQIYQVPSAGSYVEIRDKEADQP